MRGGLEHRCNGVTMVIWQEAGKYVQGAKPCPYKDTPDHRDACKEVGRLTVILPELWRAGFVGYVTMETHSLHDIMNIQASLLATLEARSDNPSGLRGIEFTLRKSLETISTPGDGQRVMRGKYLVRLEPMATWASLQLVAARQAAMGLLPVPPVVDQATGEVADGLEPPEDVEDGEFVEEPATKPRIDWPAFERALADIGEIHHLLPLLLGTDDMAAYENNHTREDLANVYRILRLGHGMDIGVSKMCQLLAVPSIAAWVDANGDNPVGLARLAIVRAMRPPVGRQPLEPEAVREAVRQHAAKGATVTASEGHRGFCVNILESLFPDEDQAIRATKRHTLSAFLLGKGSSKEWTAGEVVALLKWACKDDASTVDENAPIEAERIVRLYEAERGQQPLL